MKILQIVCALGRLLIFSVYCFLPVASCIAQRRLELILVGALSFLEVNILCVRHCTEEHNMQNEIIKPLKKKNFIFAIDLVMTGRRL